MKRLFASLLVFVLLVFCTLPSGDFLTARAAGAAQSTAPDADNITVTNNLTGTADTVYVTYRTPKDVVRVYASATSATALGTATVASSTTVCTLKITQLGTAAGTAYVTVTSSGCAESGRTAVAYDAEPVSDPPDAGDVTVTNNAKGVADTIYVSGLTGKDTVKVYNAATAGKLLVSKTIAVNASDATLTYSQLGMNAGSIYVSIKSSTALESSRTKVDYAAERRTDDLDPDFVTITNNPKGTPDVVVVTGLTVKDVIRVYSAATDGKLLASGTCAVTGTAVKIPVAQLGTSAGTVYLTISGSAYLESNRVAVSYDAEQTTENPGAGDITVVNNAKGTPDTVTVSNTVTGDVVKVYNAATGGSLLGKATAASTETTVSIPQLGTAAGSVYVTVTSTGAGESARVEATYAGEASSAAPSADKILVTNNPTGTADTIYVSGLTSGDVVKAYNAATGGTLLGKATASGASTTISVSQFGTAAGAVYVSVTSSGKIESTRTKVDYSAEGVSTAPSAGNITVTNNAVGTLDTVAVTGLTGGDIVTVYKNAVKSASFGTAAVSDGGTDATISVSQLGATGGIVYVAVKSANCTESGTTGVTFGAEGASTAPAADGVTVTNNATGVDDSIYVSGLAPNDIVKVYRAATGPTLLGTATVGAAATSVTVSVAQLGTSEGSVYVTVTSTALTESARTQVGYTSEKVAAAPEPSNITVENNAAGTSDTVTVSGLSGGDSATVYKTAAKTTALGSATAADGKTSVTISVTQLGAAGGTIYVSVKGANTLESSLTPVTFTTEEQTDAVSADSVSVTNNFGNNDTIVVTGLSANDTIAVYKDASSATALGSAAVTTYSAKATITVSQLGSGAGTVYITRTSTNKTESSRTAVAYSAEPQSAVPGISDVTVVNNAGASDTITVIGLQPSDVVAVYKSSTGIAAWGTATVTSSGSAATITVPQLGSSGGTVYISVASTNASESSRAAVSFKAETSSAAPSADNITVTNNYLIASTIAVKGLNGGDVVKVYKAAGGAAFGSETVAAYDAQAAITTSALNPAGGTIYVTVTSVNEAESTATAVSYSAQTVSTAPAPSDCTIVNNAGVSDTITLKNTTSGTVLCVYDAPSGGGVLGSATAAGMSVTISVEQLGTGAGTVYISAQTKGKTESLRTAVGFLAESASDPIQSGNVTVTNNSGASDTIIISGLSNGDVVMAYRNAVGGAAIAAATATGSLATTMTVTQLGTSHGVIWLTVTTGGKTESDRTEIDYLAESAAPKAGDVTIVNNAGISDTITVGELTVGDTVYVYSAASGGTLLGSAAVSSGSTVKISIPQLSAAAGYVYIAVANSGLAQSALTKTSYLAEQKTTMPDDGDIFVTNNVDMDDTVTVSNLSAGDTVKIYDSASKDAQLGKATVTAGGTGVTISVDDLGAEAGDIYVTKKSPGMLESDVTEVYYYAESQSSAPYIGSITVVNNKSLADTVTVTGLNPRDLVKVYDLAASGTCLGYAAVPAGGTSITISVAQLGSGSGTIYLSVTEQGKTESDRTAVDYVGESVSNAVDVTNVTVVNNPADTADTVTITGLSGGDLIQVYDTASGGNLLVSATASAGSLTVSIPQIGASAGSIYIARTSSGKAVSERVQVNFAAEP